MFVGVCIYLYPRALGEGSNLLVCLKSFLLQVSIMLFEELVPSLLKSPKETRHNHLKNM